MRRVGRAVLPGVLVSVLITAAPAWAQDPPSAARLTVSISGSTVGVGDLQSQPVVAQRLEDGAVTEMVVLRRSVRASGGVRIHVGAELQLDRSWALRVAAGMGRTRLEDAYSGEEEWLEAAGETGRAVPRDVQLAGMDAALRFMLPSANSFHPFIEVGIVGERWRSDTSTGSAFPGAEALLEAVTRVGGHAAVGGTYALTGRLAGRLQVSTQVFRTPVHPMDAGLEVGRSDTLVLTSAAPAGHGFADSSIELLRSTRLELGLTYSLLGAAAARPGRPGSAGTPTVPRR